MKPVVIITRRHADLFDITATTIGPTTVQNAVALFTSIPSATRYEEALELLSVLFSYAEPPVVAVGKRAIAHMITAVAGAAGDGPLGGGHEVTAAQHACIQRIRETLALDADTVAKSILDKVVSADHV